MRARVCRLAVVVLLAFVAFAQPSHLGDAFPLTATRYGTARGQQPLLLSNGRDPVLFWKGEGGIRVSRHVNGRFGMSRFVAAADGFDGSYDALWTGTHFLLVSRGSQGLAAWLLDATGEPRGGPFHLAEGYRPRIAFNGRHVLMLFAGPVVLTQDVQLHVFLLTPDGLPAEAQPRPLGITPDGRAALASNGDSFAALVPKAFDPALLIFDANGRLQSTSVFATHGTGVAIASDGRRYLGVAACGENGPCSPAVSRLIDAGTAGPPVELDPPFHTSPTVVWNGTRWVIAYMRDVHLEEAATLQVVQLDSSARAIERREARPAVESSLAAIGDRVLAAWTFGRFVDTIHVGPIPFDTATSVPASFTATRQTLSAIESSARGTLVVWQETGDGKTTLYTGFRTLNGDWSERAILSSAPRDCFYCYEEGVHVILAGDGQQFMLYTSGEAGPVLRRLDGDGQPVGEPFSLPFFASHLLWNGREYLLLHGDRAVTRMTADGTLGSTGTLPSIFPQSGILAAGGDGGLIAVRIDTVYMNHYPHIAGLSVVRVDRNLNLIDTTPLRLAADDQALSTLAAGWDGRQYVIAWNGTPGIMAAQIAESGPANPKTVTIAAGERANEISIEAVPGAAAILWNKAWESNSLAFLRHDGSRTTPLTVSANPDRGYESGRIAPLPNGDLAYVESSQLEPAPFENTLRVTFRVIGGAPLPPRPAAPRLTVQGDILTWEAPPQPVDGFCLEARLDDGPWIEIAVRPRDARTFRLPLTTGSRYAFRIRAWNEAGTGAYSVAGATPLKRRAVRP
ncbi:MAG TPA: fibronectin type III domain-containing protein [Thermoanaerobaculia bacterium]|nr:fibronectin type III domain-containing protein [Thermoanaerobaculia bacterium]